MWTAFSYVRKRHIADAQISGQQTLNATLQPRRAFRGVGCKPLLGGTVGNLAN